MARNRKNKPKKRRIPAHYFKRRMGIEVDSSCVKAVELHLKKDGTPVVDHIAVSELEYFKFDEATSLIRSFLRQHKFKQKQVVSCFPRSLSTFRFLDLPSTDRAEIEEMVAFQAIKQIPYSPEDMVVDYDIIKQTSDGYSTVMMIIAHKNVIYQNLDTLQDAGLVPDRIEVNSEAILRTYFHFQTLEDRSAHESGSGDQTSSGNKKDPAIALVDIDFTNTTIQIVQDSQVLFTRGITLGVMHLILKEKKYQAESANINWQSELVEELRRSFAVFARENETVAIEKIVLSGGVNNFHNIERNIHSRFHVPVEIFNLMTKLPALSNIKEKLTIHGKEISLTAPIGLMLPPRGRTIDMIPDEVRRQRRYRRRMAQLAVAATILLCMAASGAVTLYKEITYRSDMVKMYETEVNKISPKVQKLEVMRTKINVIEDQVGSDRTSLDFLREIYRIVPEKIYINAFLYDESKYIVFKGSAHAMADVFELVPMLENSSFFEKVTSRGVKKRQVGNKEIFDFEIQCSLIRTEETS